MITHSIKEPYVAPPPYQPNTHTNLFPIAPFGSYRPQQQQRDWSTKRHGFGKNEYALYLNRHNFEKGQILARAQAAFPYTEDDYVLIVDIQEIHYLAETDPESMYPLSLYVKDTKGNRFWTNHERWYVTRVVLQSVKEKLGVA